MTETRMLPPEQQICFALYSASRSMTGRYRALLAPLGLTYPQYLAMQVLWEAGSTTITGLGERLYLDSGTLSPLVKRLETLGLVTRGRSGRDERVVEIALTHAGDGMRSHAPRIAEQICAATGLAPAELTALQSQIADLAQRIRALP
jgi:DNA-binding MarR family transcriptional regulator